MSMPVTLESIQAARRRIGKVIYHSPCPHSLNLSRLCGCEVHCKLDHLQPTGSFKERGARNKLELLSADERSAGVVAASAGNHALALAYHGRALGIPVTVVMPKWAPLVKVSNCRSFGATVLFQGESYEEAKTAARGMAVERHMTYVHGFDDPQIIAGQGTLGLEILEDVPDVDAVLVSVGGGGLIAGIGTAIKAMRPGVRVIGVEARNAPTMYESLRQGKLVKIHAQPTLADGLAISEAGALCVDIVRKVVDEVVLVEEAQIATSILRLMELEKTVVEGAGAATLAAAMDPSLGLAGKKVVLVLSGGNIDITLISHIIERGLALDGRLCRIVAHVSDRPGTLAWLLRIIAETGASVKEVSHDRSFGTREVGRVAIACILETRDAEHIQQVREALEKAGVELT